MPYRWLPSALAQLAAAGIEPHEANQALANRIRTVPGVDDITGLRYAVVTGTTRAGRRLIVVLRYEGGFESAIVGAWEAA